MTMKMASCGINIAKRSSASLLGRTARNGQLGCRSIHHGHGPRSFATVVNANAPSIPSSTSTLDYNIIQPVNSAFAPLGSTIRSFGRKGSRMGHHIQNADEMGKNAKHASRKEAASEKSNDDDATGGGSDDGDFGPKEDENGNPLLPESDAVRSKMLAVVVSLERSFATIRGGEATAEMFDSVRASAYGEVVPLSSVGQVVIEDAQRATISCYDPSVAPDVRDAVRDMPGMNLNPYVEEGGSGVVVVPIPRASEETRKEMVKELGRQAENGRKRVRNIRRKAMDGIKKGKDGKMDGISKDDAFRVGKDVDSVTEEVLSILKDMVEKKQKSVMDD